MSVLEDKGMRHLLVTAVTILFASRQAGMFAQRASKRANSAALENDDEDETPHFQCQIYPSPEIPVESYPALAVALQSYIEEQCRDTLQGYIWYREPLRIAVSPASANGKLRARLTASMRHGGSVEDEWLAVHLSLLASAEERFSRLNLVRTLQQQQSHQDGVTSAGDAEVPPIAGPSKRRKVAANYGFVAAVRDEDGQFLLVEAAEALPDWVQPSNAEGRLWIAGGEIHLIPLTMHKGDAEESSPLAQALADDGKGLQHATAIDILYGDDTEPPKTVVQESVTSAIINQRMPSFPSLSWALDSQHTSLLHLPMLAAKVLTSSSQLVADAAEAFLGRDGPLDARQLRDMSTFGAGAAAAGGTASFLIRLKMPKRMYASLLGDKYFPPKTFGAEWRDEVLQFWDIVEDEGKNGKPALTEEEQRMKDNGRRRDLGCKIACGLELLLSNVKERLKAKPRNLFAKDLDEIRASVQYTRFVQTLTALGYFGDQMRDSFGWRQKEGAALALWRQNASRSDLIDQAGEQNEYTSLRLAFLPDLVQSRMRDRSLPPSIDPNLDARALRLLEDSESFLDVKAEDDEAVSGDSEPVASADDAEKEGATEAEQVAMKQVQAFADKLQTFIEGQGDEAGALFEDEGLDGKGDNDAESSEDDEDELRSAAQRHMNNLSVEEKQQAFAKLVAPLPADEWGAKKQVSANNAGTRRDSTSKMDVDENIDSEGVAARTAGSSADPVRKAGAARGFSSTVRYDGASDSEESVDDEVLRAGDTDEDRQSRARFLGIEEDLRREEARRAIQKEDGDLPENDQDWQDDDDEDDIDAEDRPLELGGDDVMDFVEFARKELGLSEDQFEGILEERRRRGAYVPDLKPRKEEQRQRPKAATVAEAGPAETEMKDDEDVGSNDSFEQLMDAMDRELLKHKSGRQSNSDAQVMEGMLQSYEAQMGGAGPVGTLMGRFGLGQLPRNGGGGQ